MKTSSLSETFSSSEKYSTTIITDDGICTYAIIGVEELKGTGGGGVCSPHVPVAKEKIHLLRHHLPTFLAAGYAGFLIDMSS